MNNNKNDEELEQLKLNITAYKFREEVQKSSALENKQRKGVNIMKKKIIATACASLILVSGIVFAINSKKGNTTDRGLGKGVETAIENGYMANLEMDFMDFDDKGTKIKIENFFMDDLNLSINFLIKFDESKNNIDKISEINLNKLVIRDEENKIIFEGFNPEFFEKYCKENNLDYKFGDFYNDNIFNCGLNWFIESKEKDMLRLTYNIYVGNCNFPKSKKLYFSLGGMQIKGFENGTENEYELDGNWNVEVDVPENMYTRTDEYYKVVNCDNSNIYIYSAKVTDTGLEIGAIISNIKKAIDDREEATEYRKILNSYIENENGDKFYCDLSPSRRNKGYYIDENNQYDFYETFGMTKYNATNKIKVVLYYYGEPVTIELEKI